ncbi:MAG: DUF72 domain-containing protein [Polyangiaceae bacterium]|nr:DUF72 domain-containing protein [Polyangiaceae bacterium]
MTRPDVAEAGSLAGMSAARLHEVEALAARAPLPAAVGRVRLGTAGWTDRTLLASHAFYPRGASTAEARLRHYAAHFPLVEVDATYYTLVAPSVAERWVEWTPAAFTFDVKAHPVLTGHPVEVARLPADLRARLGPSPERGRVRADALPPGVASAIEERFRAMVEVLHRAGRLGCVMLQYPPWVGATRGGVRRLEATAERWAGIPLAVEFRHRSWLAPERRERVLDVLRRRGLSYVVVDEPDVPGGGVPPIVAATTDRLAVVRFHGHNVAGWSRRGATVHERFDWLYSGAELREWVPRVRALAAQAAEVHAVFNNCVRNFAVLDAKALGALLVGVG